MRYVVSLVVVLGLAGVIANSVYKKVSHHHQDRQFDVAFGVVQNEKIQMHVAVPGMVTDRDPPEQNRDFVPLWGEWMDSHFILRDKKGARVGMMRIGTSALIMNKKNKIEPEFVLWAFLRKGEAYTLEFIPVLKESARYRLAFSAPMEETVVERLAFNLVTDE